MSRWLPSWEFYQVIVPHLMLQIQMVAKQSLHIFLHVVKQIGKKFLIVRDFCFSHYFQGDFSYFSYRAPKAILAQWYVYCIFPCLYHLENTSFLELRRASGGMLAFWVVCHWAWRQPACSSPQKASVLMSLPLTFPHQSICRNRPGLERDMCTAPEKQGTFFQ